MEELGVRLAGDLSALRSAKIISGTPAPCMIVFQGVFLLFSAYYVQYVALV